MGRRSRDDVKATRDFVLPPVRSAGKVGSWIGRLEVARNPSRTGWGVGRCGRFSWALARSVGKRRTSVATVPQIFTMKSNPRASDCLRMQAFSCQQGDEPCAV